MSYLTINLVCLQMLCHLSGPKDEFTTTKIFGYVNMKDNPWILDSDVISLTNTTAGE